MTIDLKTLTMQVINGDPEGVKICRVAGSTLVTVVVPRQLLGEAKALPDIPKRGVYYLLDERQGRIHRVYAGQTFQGISRLDGHNSQKDWWNKAVMFLTPDGDFSMDVVSGLESLAIQYIRDHGSYEVENSNDPKPYVSPYDEALISLLHEDILFRMTLLGFGLDAMGDEDGAASGCFYTKRRNVHGIGRYRADAGTFEVLEGSEIDMAKTPGSTKSPVKSLIALREEMVAAGTIVPGEGLLWRLVKPVSFTSPSMAADFVLGGSCNGWTEWVNDEGETLSNIFRKVPHAGEG